MNIIIGVYIGQIVYIYQYMHQWMNQCKRMPSKKKSNVLIVHLTTTIPYFNDNMYDGTDQPLLITPKQLTSLVITPKQLTSKLLPVNIETLSVLNFTRDRR